MAQSESGVRPPLPMSPFADMAAQTPAGVNTITTNPTTGGRLDPTCKEPHSLDLGGWGLGEFNIPAVGHTSVVHLRGRHMGWGQKPYQSPDVVHLFLPLLFCNSCMPLI